MSASTSISAKFVSVWDQGTCIESDCQIDPSTGVVTPAIVEIGSETLVTTLDSQYVLLGEFSIDVIEDETGVIRLTDIAALPVYQDFTKNLQELPSYVKFDSFKALTGKAGVSTLFEYMYRDAGNNKEYHEVVLAGAITPEQIRILHDNLYRDGADDDFLPRQVGLAPLCPWFDADNYDDELDHSIHTIFRVELVESKPEVGDSIVDLVNRFAQVGAEGWDLVQYGNDYR
ncbi:hypothetical protein [Pseudomonas putida]|uniref:Uncharacterized protein n=1 Tax=Pseudomonas putida TaxID=303 RepID=A0A8I1EBM9_PSEPU|nr:hypothetical protein [Pseudomonas putida]MBI6883062.1 hypothetical protein [Pseudomonas putida]